MFSCESCGLEITDGLTCKRCRPDKDPKEAIENRAALRATLQELKSQFPEEEQERRRHLFFIAMVADEFHEESQNRKLTYLENKLYNLCTQHLQIEASLRVKQVEDYRGNNGLGPKRP